MAEETRDARRAAPRSIMGTVLCTAVMGLMYLLGLLFSTPDVTALDEPIQVPSPAQIAKPRVPLAAKVAGCWWGWPCVTGRANSTAREWMVVGAREAGKTA